MRIFRTVWIASSLVLLATCTGDSDTAAPSTSSPAKGAIDPTISATDSNGLEGVASLFNYFYLGGMSPSELNLQIRQYIAECMTARGWTYVVLRPDELGDFQEPLSMAALKQYRTQYGYGYAPMHPAQSIDSSNDPNEAYFRSLSAGAQQTYGADLGNADGTSGCSAEAESQINRDVPFMAGSIDDVAREFADQLTADPRYLAALANWSSCVETRGYIATSPDILRSNVSAAFEEAVLSGRISPSDASPERSALAGDEIRAATSDFDCDVEYLHSVRIEIEQEIIQGFVEAGRLPTTWLVPPDV